MDVTPSNGMFAAMQKFVDSTVGEEPSKLLQGSAARKQRDARRMAFDFLHSFAALCMREGVNRAIIEAREQDKVATADMQDLNAIARATEDAQAGARLVVIK